MWESEPAKRIVTGRPGGQRGKVRSQLKLTRFRRIQESWSSEIRYISTNPGPMVTFHGGQGQVARREIS